MANIVKVRIVRGANTEDWLPWAGWVFELLDVREDGSEFPVEVRNPGARLAFRIDEVEIIEGEQVELSWPTKNTPPPIAEDEAYDQLGF